MQQNLGVSQHVEEINTKKAMQQSIIKKKSSVDVNYLKYLHIHGCAWCMMLKIQGKFQNLTAYDQNWCTITIFKW